jgi:CubicO group peptidase (beta-lactamase class C family)
MKPNMEIENPVARAHDLLSRAVEAKRFPGGSHLVVDAEGVRHRWQGGVADVSTRAPVDAGTLFMINSTTKVITAVAVMQLVERGKVNLDSPVRKYVPAIPYGDDLLVRHLLNYSGGVPNPLPTRWFHPYSAHQEHDERAVLAGVLESNEELEFTPGEKYLYSNLGWWLLGALVESASGQAFETYIDENIRAPLGLDEADLTFLPDDTTRMARGHHRKARLFTLILWFMTDSAIWGTAVAGWSRFVHLLHNGNAYGGLYATGDALAAFAQDMLRPEPVLMSPKTREMMFKGQRANDGSDLGTTLGWTHGSTVGTRWYSKPGGGAGFHGNVRIYPDRGIATVLLLNVTEVSESPIQEFTDAVNGSFLGLQ